MAQSRPAYPSASQYPIIFRIIMSPLVARLALMVKKGKENDSGVAKRLFSFLTCSIWINSGSKCVVSRYHNPICFCRTH